MSRKVPHLKRRTRYVLNSDPQLRRQLLANALRQQLAGLKAGSRWRFCVECWRPLLVNVGSEDERAEVLLCGRCATMLEREFADVEIVVSRSYNEMIQPGQAAVPSTVLLKKA